MLSRDPAPFPQFMSENSFLRDSDVCLLVSTLSIPYLHFLTLLSFTLSSYMGINIQVLVYISLGCFMVKFSMRLHRDESKEERQLKQQRYLRFQSSCSIMYRIQRAPLNK